MEEGLFSIAEIGKISFKASLAIGCLKMLDEYYTKPITERRVSFGDVINYALDCCAVTTLSAAGIWVLVDLSVYIVK